MGLIGPPNFPSVRSEEAAALRAALARAVVPRGTGRVGGRVCLLGRAGESEGRAGVSEGLLARFVVAWAYKPITDSKTSPPERASVYVISARGARAGAKMYLRNMGSAWPSSIMPTCFLGSSAAFSISQFLSPKSEVFRRPLAAPPVSRPDAPHDVGGSEARRRHSTARARANPRQT